MPRPLIGFGSPPSPSNVRLEATAVRGQPDSAWLPNGLLLVDKPSGVTSHDVVQLVRRKLSIRRVGHTGTLDPIAEGLLLLLVGAATRHQQAFQGHDKLYDALIRLGTQTDTADATGAVVRTLPVPPLQRSAIEMMLQSLQGPLVHVPPAYSAVKVKGRPAYWWTRRQQPVTLAQRTVHLTTLSLIEVREQTIRFQVHCSAGTYVRVLAERIAEQLGTVGHLAGLTRLRIGSWRLEQARPLAWFADASSETIRQALYPVPRSPAA